LKPVQTATAAPAEGKNEMTTPFPITGLTAAVGARRRSKAASGAKPRELSGVVLMTLNVFLLMTTYYVLKTVRESLILTQGGAEVKSYSAAAQTLLLLAIVPAYSALASRLRRAALVGWVTLLFAVSLLLFYWLDRAGFRIGVAFFIWLGIFSVTAVTQFWAFANDLYTQEEGLRALPTMGIGAAMGALAGAFLAGWAFRLFGIGRILLIAAGLLLLCIAITHLIDRRASGRCRAQASLAERPIGGDGAFRLVFGNRYFLLIAAVVVLANVVNTTGEFVLSKMAIQTASRMTAGHAASAALKAQYIGRFYARYFEWSGLAGLFLQALFVPRVLRRLGAKHSLFVLPGISLLGYAFLAFVPAMRIAQAAKIAENSMDYSLEKTALNVLFLGVGRAAKYKAKTAIDTFFYRSGDLLVALMVGTGSSMALPLRGYAWANVACTVMWLGVIVAIGRSSAGAASSNDGEPRLARLEAVQEIGGTETWPTDRR
jgi:AAA family ATP:ADP antiporter